MVQCSRLDGFIASARNVKMQEEVSVHYSSIYIISRGQTPRTASRGQTRANKAFHAKANAPISIFRGKAVRFQACTATTSCNEPQEFCAADSQLCTSFDQMMKHEADLGESIVFKQHFMWHFALSLDAPVKSLTISTPQGYIRVTSPSLLQLFCILLKVHQPSEYALDCKYATLCIVVSVITHHSLQHTRTIPFQSKSSQLS